MCTNKITENQLKYIRILSSYDSTWIDDLEDIILFLIKCGKKSLKELTKGEASLLIQKLLERPVMHVFPCEEKEILHKTEVNQINVLGTMESCLHFCPKGIDIHDCIDFQWNYDLYEIKESIINQIVSISTIKDAVSYCEKCQVCRKIAVSEILNKYISLESLDENDLYKYISLESPDKSDLFFVGKLYEHHISYSKDKTVFVCSSCHAKIHRDPTHSLYPTDKPK